MVLICCLANSLYSTRVIGVFGCFTSRDELAVRLLLCCKALWLVVALKCVFAIAFYYLLRFQLLNAKFGRQNCSSQIKH